MIRRSISVPRAEMNTDGTQFNGVRWSNKLIKDVLIKMRNRELCKWEYAIDMPPAWTEQLDTEICREVRNKTTGKYEMRWVAMKRDNHAWDCECMQVVAATMAKIIGSGSEPEPGEEKSE